MNSTHSKVIEGVDALACQLAVVVVDGTIEALVDCLSIALNDVTQVFDALVVVLVQRVLVLGTLRKIKTN